MSQQLGNEPAGEIFRGLPLMNMSKMYVRGERAKADTLYGQFLNSMLIWASLDTKDRSQRCICGISTRTLRAAQQRVCAKRPGTPQHRIEMY